MALKYADILNQTVGDTSDEVSLALSRDSLDYAQIAKEVAKAQAVVTPIMQKVRDDINKGWKQLPNSDAKRSPKSWFFDPLTLQYSLGYKDRRFSLSFDILKKTVSQLSILGAIINTRIAQVCSFAKPYRHTRSLGFVIKHKDPDHKTTSAEVAMIKDLENFIMNCGRADPNPYSRKRRDDFGDFLAKIVRDSLSFDQACSEIVYDKIGLPYEFYAVDGSTIRIACHPAGTRIEMPDGTVKNIEDINVGDEVRTHTGRVKPVTALKESNYTGYLYTFGSGVKTGDRTKTNGKAAQQITATYNHPLLIVSEPDFKHKYKNGKDYTRWVQAKDVEKGDYLVYPKPKLDRNRDISFDIFTNTREYANIPYQEIADATGFSKDTVWMVLTDRYLSKEAVGGGGFRNATQTITEYAKSVGFDHKTYNRPDKVVVDKDFAKLCGLYVAEGGNNGGRTARFTYHEDETDLINFTVNLVQKLGVTTSIRGWEGRKAVGVEAHSTDLTRFFMNEFGVGSLNKKIPEWLLNSALEIKQSFLVGYLLGDAKCNGKSAVFTTISKNLAHGLRVLCADLGIYFRILEKESDVKICDVRGEEKVFNRKKQYSGYLGGSNYRKIVEEEGLVEPVKLQRPREAYLQDDKYFYIKIDHVEKEWVEDFPVYNFAVEGDNSYVANGYGSHNSDDRYVGVNSSYHSRSGFVPAVPSRFAGLYEGREYGRTDITTAEGKPVSYVQVVNGQIENIYSDDELIFGVRNPRTDIYVQGYGLSEIEQGLTIISSMLYSEMYNRANFTNGAIPMGILNLKGDNWTDEQLEAFKRHWTSQVAGAENAKKTPVLQSEGIEWIDFNKTNRDMEFSSWLEYLLKVLCALYRIDPAELNFEMQGGVQQTPLFESAQEWKLKASRDRGLKPLLGFIAKLINKHIIDKIDDHFALEFVGLDEMSEEDKHNMLTEQLSSYMTLNEVRRQLDMPDLPEGDIPMNPTYLEVLKMKQEQELQEQQMQQEQEMQQEQGGEEEQPMEADMQNYLPASDPEAVEEEPRFTNNVGLPTETDIY